jgi:putative DNA primase/helicase
MKAAVAPSEYELANPAAFGPPPLESITIADLLKRDFPPRELLLSPWLPVQGLAMIYAARGVGKTHLALAVAYAVATGGKALCWDAPKPRRVLIVDGEMPAATLQERWVKIVEAAGDEPPEPDYVRILAADMQELGLPDLATAEGQAALAPELEGVELIVLDNLSTLCRSGKENEADSWAAVQGWLLAQRRAGRSVLLIHHAGKGGDQRGTSKREDVLDRVIRLDRPNGYDPKEGARFTVTFTKARGFSGDAADSFEARLDGATWTTRPVADALAERVFALADEGLTQRDIATEVDTSAAKVNRILKKREGGAGGWWRWHAPGSRHWPPLKQPVKQR